MHVSACNVAITALHQEGSWDKWQHLRARMPLQSAWASSSLDKDQLDEADAWSASPPAVLCMWRHTYRNVVNYNYEAS
eukprot:4184166-Amphidinium_carterae.1